jgi:hypothetical protein
LRNNYRQNRDKYSIIAKQRYFPGKDSKRNKKYREVHRIETLERRRKYKTSEIGRKLYAKNEANRRCLKLKATVKYANLEKIKEIYKNCPSGYHVDHIVPLKGVNVCGLHVEYNLQYLPAIENIRKGNRLEKVG